MFGNPYGASMGNDPGAFMRMLPMLFGQKQGMGGSQQPQMPQQQQQPQDMFSGVKNVLDPNSNFMSSLMKSLGGGGAGGAPSMGGQRTGAPISNTPSTNMQNNPFMQMPWQNGGMKQGQ